MKLHTNNVLLGLVIVLAAIPALSYQSSVQSKNKLATLEAHSQEMEQAYTDLQTSSEQLKQNITTLKSNYDNLEWKNKQLMGNLECINSKGEWVNFANPCSDDSCTNLVNPPFGCTKATVDGCDCGIDMCWNGEKCITNERFMTLEVSNTTNDVEVEELPFEIISKGSSNGHEERGAYAIMNGSEWNNLVRKVRVIAPLSEIDF